MLTDAALEGKIDRLERPEGERDHRQADPGGHGPQALPRGSRSSRRSRCPAAIDDVGLLEGDDLAAELGLADGDGLGGFGRRSTRTSRPSRTSARAARTRASPRSSRTSTSPRTSSRSSTAARRWWSEAPGRTPRGPGRAAPGAPRRRQPVLSPLHAHACAREPAERPERLDATPRCRSARPCHGRPPKAPELQRFGVRSGTSRAVPQGPRPRSAAAVLMVQACERDADCRRAASTRRTPLRRPLSPSTHLIS